MSQELLDELNKTYGYTPLTTKQSIQQYFNELPTKMIGLGVKVLFAILIFIIGVKLINLIRKVLKKSLSKISKIDEGVIQFTDSLLKVVFYIFLILIIAINFGIETTSIAALISSISIAIGLALQGSLSNFAGGILILLMKPFKVGDFIKENTYNNEGTVKEISMFYTKLLTYDNKTIVLPNGTLANASMVNYSDDGKRRIDIKVSISYDADLKKAKTICKEIVEKNKKVLQNMQKDIFVSDLNDSAVIIGVRCYTESKDYWEVRWHILEDIKLTFDKQGIKIPYPQMEVHINK